MTSLKKLGATRRPERPYEELSYLVAIVYNHVNRKLENLLRGYGLSVPKFNILMILKYQGGDNGLSQKGIAERLIVSDGNITGILDRMEKERLVIRTQHPRDRRINLVRVTLKASDLVRDILPAYDALLKENVGLISKKQQNALLPVFGFWAKRMLRD